MANGIPARLTRAEGRKFGLTVGIAFLVLAAISRWRGHTAPVLVMGTVGVALIAAALVIPTYLGPVNRAWMGLAHAISKVTTPVFMAVVYFLVMMPAGVLMRLFGRNPVRNQLVKGSYWAARTASSGDMNRQF